MRRRRFLGGVSLGAVGGFAGCLRSFETTRSREPPVVEDRPDAPYVPTHSDGMAMVGVADAGDRRVAVTYTYPHRFWVVEKEDGGYVSRKVAVDADDAIHLMVSVWEPETRQVLPSTTVSVEVVRDGEVVGQETVYSMLSQRMGTHYGDNFPLDGDGTYALRVTVGGTPARRFGSLASKLGEAATAELSFEYSERERNDLSFERLGNAGDPGAVDPMQTGDRPSGVAPASLGGTPLGEATSGSLRFPAAVLDAERFGADPYLAVSPRTRHNGYVVPRTDLVAGVDGEELPLKAGLDPELGFHYGASVPTAPAAATLSVRTPPQVARHEGYETAFLSFEEMRLGG